MLARWIRIPALYQGLPCKESKEIHNNIIYNVKAFWTEWAGRFRLMSGVATRELETLFDQVGDLLNNRLDNLMKIFVNRDPNFYNGYEKARMIMDYQ
ncbi:MAG: hypothetical protein K9I74_08040 [Bacteroidales bacterium]|nr:hypothetical protein [Bacteroidales bacterium]